MVDHNFMKRMAPFLVLEILKAYTDEQHGLKVTEIVELLNKDYSVSMERKAVSRILNDLYELSEISENYDWKNPMRFTILCKEHSRSNGNIRENWRLCKEFEDAEIRLLSDLVVSVPAYPSARLLKKLQRLGSSGLPLPGFAKIGAINHQMPICIDCIEQAMQKGMKIAFDYGKRRTTVSPYKMAFRSGIYYLVCFDENKDDMAIFQIEHMHNAVMLDAPTKDYHMVKGSSQWGYDLEHYLDGCLASTEK